MRSAYFQRRGVFLGMKLVFFRMFLPLAKEANEILFNDCLPLWRKIRLRNTCWGSLSEIYCKKLLLNHSKSDCKITVVFAVGKYTAMVTVK